MKKLFALCLTVVLLIAMMPVVGVSAADVATFSAGNVTAAPGEEVTVPVSIDTNPGLTFAQIKVGYDAEALELVDIELLTFAGKESSSGPLTNNPIAVTFSDCLKDTTATGDLANLKFKVKETAAVGTYTLTVTATQTNVFDVNDNDVPFTTVNGSVNVVAPITDDTAVFSAGQVTGAPGETVSVPVTIDANPGLTFAQIKVGYDAEVLELVDIELLTFAGKESSSGPLTNNPIAVTFSDCLKDTTETGALANLKFKIKETTEVGTYTLTVTATQTNVFDVNDNDVPFATFNGSVTVAIPEECKHTNTYVEGAVDATCSAEGSTGTTKCSDCGETIMEAEAIEKLAHTPADATEENRVDATCSAEGSYESVVCCGVCGEELSRETIAIEKLAHTPADATEENRVDATCTAEGSYESVVCCGVCGEELSRETIVIEKIAHTWAEVVADKYLVSEATTTSKAIYSVSCSVCGQAHETETFEYGELVPSFTPGWNKDDLGWTWINEDGSIVKDNWVLDGGKWYFFDSNGYMVSNQWRKDSIGWVYLGSDGAMLTNAWCTDSQGWCYVGADGYAVTNCWKQDSIGWIWLNSEGSMTKNQWILDGGNWYYLDSNGYMLASTSQYIDGKTYNFNASGVCTNP